MPAARATDPNAAAAHGAARRKRICAMEAEPVRAKVPEVAARWLVVWKSSPDSCGPRERNRPAIDQDETAPRAASRNGLRIVDGTYGRWGVSCGRDRSTTGSGMCQTPTDASANSIS